MGAVKILLSEDMQAFVDQQVSAGNFVDSGEFVRELISREHDRLRLRQLLLEGQASGDPVEANGHYFAELRALALSE